MLDDVRVPAPGRRVALRALVTARVAGARYDAGEVERAQELSIEALDLARTSGDAHAIAIAVGGPPHRAVVPRGARRTVCNSTPSCARSGGRSRCRRKCGGSATCSSAAGWKKRTAPWTRWSVACSRARSRVPRTTSRLYRALRAQINGLVDEAGRRSEEARAIGAQVGARRAGLSYAVQSLFVARERRELDGLVELLDALAAEHPNQPGFLTTAAWVRIETGRFDEARVQFDAIAADGFDSLLRNGVWLPNIRLLSEIASALETPGPAARIYELMLPYRDRYIVTSARAQLPRVGRALARRPRPSRPATSTGPMPTSPRRAPNARRPRCTVARGPHRSRDRRAARRRAAMRPARRSCGPGCTRKASRTAGSTWPPTRPRAPPDARRAPGFRIERVFATLAACSSRAPCSEAASPRSTRGRASSASTSTTTAGSTSHASGCGAPTPCWTRCSHGSNGSRASVGCTSAWSTIRGSRAGFPPAIRHRTRVLDAARRALSDALRRALRQRRAELLPRRGRQRRVAQRQGAP